MQSNQEWVIWRCFKDRLFRLHPVDVFIFQEHLFFDDFDRIYLLRFYMLCLDHLSFDKKLEFLWSKYLSIRSPSYHSQKTEIADRDRPPGRGYLKINLLKNQ